MPLLYMAGSMGTADGSDWRQGWRPKDLPDIDIVGDGERADVAPVVTRIGARHRFRYTGPFGDGMSDHSFSHGLDGGAGFEDDIFRRAIAGIDRAEVVMARIDLDPVVDCYGTLAEIGYAFGTRKPVYLMLIGGDMGYCGDVTVHHRMSMPGHPAWFAASMARVCVSARKGFAGEAVKVLAAMIVSDTRT
jgi:hypothetical protein